MSQTKLETMFDRYARNWDQVKQHLSPPFSQLDDVVICPLCSTAFNRSELHKMSLEHIPPGALGGQARTLTCTKCNNTVGSRLEGPLAEFMDFVGVLGGVPGSEVDVTYTVNDGEYWLPATFRQLEAGGWHLIGHPARTKPGEIQKQIDQATIDSGNVNFRVRFKAPFLVGRPPAALLRIAYLWCFSVFGYSFLFNPNLANITHQISDPDTPILSNYGLIQRQFPDEMLGVSMITEPANLRSMIVVFDLINKAKAKARVGVILPSHIGSASDLYDTLLKHQNERFLFNLSLTRMQDDFDFLGQPFFLHDFWGQVQNGMVKKE